MKLMSNELCRQQQASWEGFGLVRSVCKRKSQRRCLNTRGGQMLNSSVRLGLRQKKKLPPCLVV